MASSINPMPQALVVDDSKAMRGLIRRQLEIAGFAVEEAGDGEEGLHSLAQLPSVSLIVLDWNMPNMDGLEFLRRLRADDLHGAAKVLMVTSESNQDRVQEALALGANEYLMKPITEDMFTEKLNLLESGLY